MSAPQFLALEWEPPPGVRVAFTLRAGGVSEAPFDELNLGGHVGDRASDVGENRRRLHEHLRLPAEPSWLDQVHGREVHEARAPAASAPARADAVIVRDHRTVGVIQVADCMPVVLASRDGRAVAAAHAGWRGLAAGVLEATVERLDVPASELSAWLGPAIGPAHFEVGDEVRQAFVLPDPGVAPAFAPNPRGRWQCDLPSIARSRLRRLGVGNIAGGNWCTYADPARFFSYRRDGRCGRMAALVWLG